MWQHVDCAALTEGSCQLHCKQLSQARAAKLRMRAALIINSPEWVWSKCTHATQLACARLLEPVILRGKLSGTNGTSLKMKYT